MSTDARPSVLIHATEELLEEYSFGRIREPQLGRLEEHLLICPQCQSALDEVEEYKVFMKAGLASFESERQAAAGSSNLPGELRADFLADLPAGPDSPVRRWSWLPKLPSLGFTLPGLLVTRNLLAAALVFVLAGATWAWRMQSSPAATAPLAIVKLIALRGGEGDATRAPAGRPLDLVFSRTDLAADVSYRAQVVDASGRQAWIGNVGIAEQSLSIRVDGPLRAGEYWVRLYSSAGQLLREFGLLVG